MVILDLANETVLKAVVWAIGGQSPPKDGFPQLLKQVRAVVGARRGVEDPDQPLPGELGVSQVHRVRNDAQHRALAPSHETLAICRTHTYDFLSQIVDLVWGIDLDTLAASGQIRSEKCRTLIEEAESALRDGEYLAAARKARTALDWATYLAGSKRFGHKSYFFTLSQYESWNLSGQNPLAGFSRDVQKELDELWAVVRPLALGLDERAGDTLARHTGYRLGSLESDQWSEPDAAPDSHQAEWCVAYATGEIIGLEDRIGELPEPRSRSASEAQG